jgi:hypothetical protein
VSCQSTAGQQLCCRGCRVGGHAQHCSALHSRRERLRRAAALPAWARPQQHPLNSNHEPPSGHSETLGVRALRPDCGVRGRLAPPAAASPQPASWHRRRGATACKIPVPQEHGSSGHERVRWRSALGRDTSAPVTEKARSIRVSTTAQKHRHALDITARASFHQPPWLVGRPQ